METDLPFKTWKYEEQTKMKHRVFAEYLPHWVNIVGSSNALNFFDCFGGCGAYEESDGKISFGSPVLAAEIVKKNEKNIKNGICLVVMDTNKDNLENIKKILEYKKLDVKVHFINEDFDTAINKMLDNSKNIAPSFFLVDPFGFKIKIETLKRMMAIGKSEIILNFMYNGINRNLGVRDADSVLTDLFGSDEWKKIKDLDSREKEKELVELFRSKLKGFCKFVYYYRMSFPNMDRTYYYLFHLTNYYLGCEIMKSAFAKHNRGRCEYRGKSQNQMTFFDYDDVKIPQIKKYILSTYQGQIKLFLNIIEEQIDETPYLVEHIRKSIQELEKEGKLEIRRENPKTPTGKESKSLNNGDTIVFK